MICRKISFEIQRQLWKLAVFYRHFKHIFSSLTARRQFPINVFEYKKKRKTKVNGAISSPTKSAVSVFPASATVQHHRYVRILYKSIMERAKRTSCFHRRMIRTKITFTRKGFRSLLPREFLSTDSLIHSCLVTVLLFHP